MPRFMLGQYLAGSVVFIQFLDSTSYNQVPGTAGRLSIIGIYK